MYNKPMLFDYLLSLVSIHVVVATAAGLHVLLYKRDSRSALGWLGLVFLFPIAGALLYTLFGVNRVHRKAHRLSSRFSPEGGRARAELPGSGQASIRRIGLAITGGPLRKDNRVDCYHNGEQAYPPMLQAIEQAREEILLSSYIFDNDRTGQSFIRKLAAAHDRGVAVRILVDDVGLRYSFPTILRLLKKHRLEHRRFMPLRLLPPSLSINLRTHRKLLLTDRCRAFAGGMNISDRQLINGPSKHRASDLHFGFSGPVVADLVRLFIEDWKYAGGSDLNCPEDLPGLAGQAECRVISDGPDETMDALALTYMGVISAARQKVWIMTPYFLPDRKIMGSLQAAALAGVDVQVMIPRQNNWPLVQWALQHNLAELLDSGVRLLLRPPPFAHSKCLMVDDDYSLVGSSNLDPRSLRLNFELGIEVFDSSLNHELCQRFQQAASQCTSFTRRRLDARKLPTRLRDAAAALFAPYL